MNAILYIDTGSGFSSEKAFSIPITGREERIEFQLGPYGFISRVRLEPIPDFLVLRIRDVQIFLSSSNSYSLETFSTNSIFDENMLFFFATQQPQITINLYKQKVDRIVFLMEYNEVGRSAAGKILDKYWSMLGHQEKQILQHIQEADAGKEALQKITEEHLKNIQKLNQIEPEAEYLRQFLESLLNSRSWKITAMIRKTAAMGRHQMNTLRRIGNRAKGDYGLIERSGLFDDSYYRETNPDVAALGIDPITHYLSCGAREGRNPHPLFNTRYYLEQNSGAVRGGMNPLVHFIRAGSKAGKDPHRLFSTPYYLDQSPGPAVDNMNPLTHFMKTGAREGRSPHPLFNTRYYLEQNPEAAEGKMNPLVHFIRVGSKAGKDPHPLFSVEYYLSQDPDLFSSGMDPVTHYLEIGAKQGKKPHPLFDPTYYRKSSIIKPESEENPLIHYLHHKENWSRNPHPLFDASYYLKRYPEVGASGENPLSHYIARGVKTGRNPNPLFDSSYYLKKNPDVDAAGINPLSHYVQSGSAEKRNPNPLFESQIYLKHYPDAENLAGTLLEHYLSEGAVNGANPGPLFNTKFYLDRYPDVARSGLNPLAHYLEFGVFEGRIASPLMEVLPKKPLISILVPVYKVKEELLRQTIRSVLFQIYPNWELCLVDDGSNDEAVKKVLLEFYQNQKIKIKMLAQNQGISVASNEAAALAEGEYIGLLDHDDLLSMDALYTVVKAVNEHSPDILYSDEGLIDETGRYHDSIFKPDFSPDLLLSHNYVTHFLVFKRDLFLKIGGFRSQCDGAQDYDLVLRLLETTEKIHHIPKILYLWRKSESSTSLNPSNKSYAIRSGMQALEDALFRRAIKGTVENGNLPFFYRVKRAISGMPLISILIPFRDQPMYLKKCVQSVLSKSSYSHFELLGIDNGSEQEETASLIEELEKVDPRIRFFRYPGPFNYSKINNFGAQQASGDILLLLNNDIEILNSGWLEALLEHAQRDEIGAVGGKLYYPNETIQHAGVIIGIAGFAGHSHRHLKKEDKGYGNRLNVIQNVSAVSGAMLMVKRKLYMEIGGLDEDHLTIGLNDIDFCLKLRQRNFFNIFTPYCEAIHYESVSRGYEETPERKMRFEKEIRYFKTKWKQILFNGDPFYNPNLTLEREDFSPRKEKEHSKR